ncbi:MAG: glycosyltransferase family 39 protein, partial [Leptolyngbyaceae cyanobacterium MO_188.B28]|nr:glycosyltransferase family 39 protein [Leptolyngbyaceae cyanobacterium MO_188.B28]
MKSLILNASFMIVQSELLSIGQNLNRASVLWIWSIICIVNIGMILILVYQERIVWRGNNVRLPSFRRFQGGIAIALSLLLILTFGTAFIAPPNNWDSMTYHMPRVMHWIQNQSVHMYPTANLRQISFSPGGGYLITQLQLLSGSDRWANCVQWIAYLGCILSTGMTTRYLLRLTWEAWPLSIVSATIPMAIMQSATTQTDLLTAFWLSCFAYFIFCQKNNHLAGWGWMICALALAIVTKPTAIIFGFPLGVVLFAQYFQQELKRQAHGFKVCVQVILRGMWFTIGAFSLSLGSYWRNAQIFPNFLGTDTGTRVTDPSIVTLGLNSLQNLYLSFPVPPLKTLILQLYSWTEFEVSSQVLNFGEPLSEQSSFKILARHEDFVGAPIQLLLFGLRVIILYTPI